MLILCFKFRVIIVHKQTLIKLSQFNLTYMTPAKSFIKAILQNRLPFSLVEIDLEDIADLRSESEVIADT